MRQVIAEQEKDSACLNEEKRYFQMKLMELERFLEEKGLSSFDEATELDLHSVSCENDSHCSSLGSQLSIPPTILECDDDFEDAVA